MNFLLLIIAFYQKAFIDPLFTKNEANCNEQHVSYTLLSEKKPNSSFRYKLFFLNIFRLRNFTILFTNALIITDSQILFLQLLSEAHNLTVWHILYSILFIHCYTYCTLFAEYICLPPKWKLKLKTPITIRSATQRARGRQRPRADILGTSIHLRDYHYPTYLHNLGPKLPSSQDTDLSSWVAE